MRKTRLRRPPLLRRERFVNLALISWYMAPIAAEHNNDLLEGSNEDGAQQLRDPTGFVQH